VTTIETGPGRYAWMDPRNWGLAWKLVVVGLVPALLALFLGGLRVTDQAGAADDLGRNGQLLDVRQQVAAAANALRQERDEATLFVAGGGEGNRGVLEIAFEQTDSEINDMRVAVRGATVNEVLGSTRTTSGLDPTALSALQQTESGLTQITPLRTDAINNPDSGYEQVRGGYDTIIKNVDVLDRALLRSLLAPGTAGLADALTAVTSATEQLALQHTVLGAAIRSDRVLPSAASTVSATDYQLTAAIREYRVALTPEQLNRFGNILDDAANAQRKRLEAAILAVPASLTSTEWDNAYSDSRAAVDRSADLIRNELVTVSSTAEEQARNLAGINSVVLIFGLLVGILIAVLTARALLRSLRVLRSSALDVAERRLPQVVESMRAGDTPDITVEPVPVYSRDEVGQVARAFDAVHGQAVRLAAEQVVLQSNVSSMFVNLSRRSQALVERQLRYIELLEGNEQDPDQLSNLFQLDHLATRMRRNSENLLILAGTDLAKRNTAPVPTVDVLRAAVSEIEQYQRIVVQAPPTVTIVGRAASDLVHLLAELLDNATNFSPPDSQVVMSTSQTAEGSIVVEIADRGVGMAEHELNDANQRLGGAASVDVSASRRMGLFVVGRLGVRHGISVRLSSATAGGPGSGLTASVTVPAYLIPSNESADTGRLNSVPRSAGGDPGLDVAPYRAATNGSRSPGSSPSAPVTGSDGPESPLFSTPSAADDTTGSPAASGSGSTVRPEGSSLSPKRRDPAEHAAAEQAAAERAAAACEIAEQARRDQEAAAERAAPKQHPDDEPPDATSTAGLDPELWSGSPNNGSHRNGSHTDASRLVPNESRPERSAPDLSAPAETPEDDTGQDDQQAGGSTGTEPETILTETGTRTGPMPFFPATAPMTAVDRTEETPERSEHAPKQQPPPGPQRTRQDGLFSPGMSVPAEPDRPASGHQRNERQPAKFDPSETTPIFEEIVSAWFRSKRPLPVGWEAEQGDAPQKVDQSATQSPTLGEVAEQERIATSGPAPDQGFASPADEVWHAANDMSDELSDELTEAGLPKRRPRARLVPGSAGSAVLASPPSSAARNAENIRGRLSSYQQGVRQGREGRLRRDTGSASGANKPADTGGNHDEESS